MTDYVITNGRISNYPPQSFGAQFVDTRATFCLDADFAGLSANVLAIPNLPITVLTAVPITVPASFFGLSVQKVANYSLTGITASTVRSHDLQSGVVMWKFIEVADGVFNWTNIDTWVNANYPARDLVFTLYGTPTISANYSARPTEQCAYGPSYLGVAAEPSDMTKWSRFCTQLATRYAGRIKYYEIWNEPNYNNSGVTTPTSPGGFYFSGTFAKLAQMTRLANLAIKAVDPAAKIISSPITDWSPLSGQAAETWFTTMMAADDGASGTMAQWVDIVGVHLYLPAPNRVQDLTGMIDRVNAAKTAAGIAALPTWDTESAPHNPDLIALSDDAASRVMARMALTMAAKGIARSIYYQYDHGTMGFVGRAQIVGFRERLIPLMQSGNIQTVSRFTDGRVAIYTDQGLSII
jgi:hypothetical protein